MLFAVFFAVFAVFEYRIYSKLKYRLNLENTFNIQLDLFLLNRGAVFAVFVQYLLL